VDSTGSVDILISSASRLDGFCWVCAGTWSKRELCEEFALGNIMGDIALGVAGGAYSIAASGVSERGSTRSRRSCSNGSAKGSVMTDSLKLGMLSLAKRPYGDRNC
jgi:hypothetical protein